MRAPRIATLLASGLFASLLLGAMSAQAAGTVVLEQTEGSTYAFGTATNGGNFRTVCQSFVATSPDVSQIDLMLGTYGAYSTSRRIELFLTRGNCKNASGYVLLAQHQLTQAEYDAVGGGTTQPLTPKLLQWDLGAPAPILTVGETYYFGVRQLDACQNCLSTVIDGSDPYADGSLSVGYWTDAYSGTGSDLWFKLYSTQPPTPNVQTIKVAVVFADLIGDPNNQDDNTLHDSSTPEAAPCKLQYAGKPVSFKGHSLSYFQDLAHCVSDYYRENSYGSINLEFTFFDDDGHWYSVPQTYLHYAQASEPEFVEDSVTAAGIPSVADPAQYQIVIGVHAGDFKGFDTDDGILMRTEASYEQSLQPHISLAETNLVGAWTHELGHALGYLTTPQHIPTPDLYKDTNLGQWDVMADGSYNGNPPGSDPSNMSSYTKEFLGYLGNDIHAKPETGPFDINSLETSEYRDGIFRYNLGATTNPEESKYYILEARTKYLGTWDSSAPVDSTMSSALLVYSVNTHGNGEYDLEPYTDPVTQISYLRPTVQLRSVNITAVLTPSGQKYLDIFNGARVTALSDYTADGKYGIRATIADISPADFAQSYFGAAIDGASSIFSQISASNPLKSELTYRTSDGVLVQSEDGHGPTQTEIVRGYRLMAGVVTLLFLALLPVFYLMLRRAPKDKRAGLFSFMVALSLGAGIVGGIVTSLFTLKVQALEREETQRLSPSVNVYPTKRTWIFGRYLLPPAGSYTGIRPDLDLHVWCPDGRHVGMNYATGEYENQIADDITNGDNQGAPEWILIPPTPENASCTYSVSAHDDQAFLDANPDVAAALGSATDSYSIYARYIDPASGIYTSATLEDQSIEPGQSMTHEIAGTTDVAIDAGVPDVTPPVTTAAASGTLWSDGATYVSDVTVTLSAQDDASGVAKTLYSLDGGATYVPYAGQIVLTQDGDRTVTFSSVDGGGNAEAPKTFTLTIDHAPAAATVNVSFQRHTVQSGNQPGSTKAPVASAEVEAFSTASGSCAAGIGLNPHDYETVLTTCTPDHSGTTDASGALALPVAPGDYLLLARDPETQVVAGVDSGPLADLDATDKFLQVIVRADGTSVPAKTTKHVGSLLYVIEPEYVTWDQPQELYPFVFDAPDGDWGVTVTVTPPEGFTADYASLSTDVNNDYKALQFTLTDVGSCWDCGTGVDIEIHHKGKVIRQTGNISTPMTERFAREKGLSDADAARKGIIIKKKKP